VRVLIVSNLYPPISVGGYEACCEMVATRLAEEHEVHVLTSRRGRDRAPAQARVRRALPLFSEVRGDALRGPLYTAAAMRVVRQTLAHTTPELILVFNAAGIPKGAVRALEASGTPLAYFVHDHWFDEPYRGDPFTRYLRGRHTGAHAAVALVARALNRLPALRVDLRRRVAAAVCFNSQAIRRLTTVADSTEVRLDRVVYPATRHEELFAALTRRPSERPRILFVGRIEQVKGPQIAYRALGALRDDHGLDAELVLCGAPDERLAPELRRLAAELGIADRITVRGALSPRALASELASAHALIVPSVWQEPFGLVALEGALARVPVVAARSGGLTEILDDPQHALLFEIGDWQGAARALARTLSEPAPTAERVSRAAQRAREFSVERFLSGSEAFVRDALAALAADQKRDRGPTEPVGP
jgi:glycosyltransferase involved in cell wall biosynthesis